MKAVAIREHGGLEKIEVLDLPKPEPKAGEALVRVRAASLNRLDLFTINGIKGLVLKMPHVPGGDAAGVLEAFGPGAERAGFKVADRVTFNPGVWCTQCEMCRRGEESQCANYGIIGEHMPGAMAEFVTVPARNLVKIPADVPFEVAAAAPLVYQTAWRELITRAQIRLGETVVVVGAGSGVSTAAIQIAARAGCRVIATSSTPEKLAKAKALGATDLINYKTEDWSKRVYELTGKRGADVVLDSVGKETLNQSIRSLRKGGRVVIIGGTTGQEVDLNLRYVYWKQVSILGSTMGSHREFEDVMALVFNGQLKPVVGAQFPMAQARAAFQLMERGENFGKIVLTF
ncbi:MAG TPA: zinc-binding dehydrogenase [Candidatus Thermoplasmatota archaeon]|nr:zinc-binding dehydrogenase [Candidatus Thermoplasmatota archaeon]